MKFSFHMLKIHGVEMGKALHLVSVLYWERKDLSTCLSFCASEVWFWFFVIASSIFFQGNLVKWLCSEVQIIDAGDQLKQQSKTFGLCF